MFSTSNISISCPSCFQWRWQSAFVSDTSYASICWNLQFRPELQVDAFMYTKFWLLLRVSKILKHKVRFLSIKLTVLNDLQFKISEVWTLAMVNSPLVFHLSIPFWNVRMRKHRISISKSGEKILKRVDTSELFEVHTVLSDWNHEWNNSAIIHSD